MRHRLSKSRYLAGEQCPKLLWWKVHEPDAPELQPDASLAARFAAGDRVNEHARARFPGGAFVDRDVLGFDGSIDETQRLMREGVPAIFEAAFRADGVYVAVDVLERDGEGWRLIEVKSSCDVKEQHAPDVAIQAHVLRQAGVRLTDVELMHLNRECRYPRLDNLFVRTSLRDAAAALEPELPARIAQLLALLDAALPEVSTGPHCDAPYACPFKARCWPELAAHHVGEIYRLSKRARGRLDALGCARIHDIPDDFEISAIGTRQVAAVKRQQVIVDEGLRAALGTLTPPLAFYDFETIGPAIPCWDGCRPYQPVPVQFSVHVAQANGQLEHFEWLASGGCDPRRELAERLIEATRGVSSLVAYNASFETGRVTELASAFPDLAAELGDIAARTVDLLPIVRNHVYHPDFRGGFGLKSVAPALLPHLSYDELTIASGDVASTVLERLVLEPETMTPEERESTRAALLAYCERDTLALVELLKWLRGVS